MKNSTELPQKIETRTTCNSAIPLLGIYQKTEEHTLKFYRHASIHYSVLYSGHMHHKRWVGKENVF